MRFIDALSTSKFALWYIIGYYLPRRYTIAFIVSLIWEAITYAIVSQENVQEWLRKNWGFSELYWNEPIENKVSDVIFSLAGYAIGSNVRKDRANVVAMGVVWLTATMTAMLDN